MIDVFLLQKSLSPYNSIKTRSYRLNISMHFSGEYRTAVYAYYAYRKINMTKRGNASITVCGIYIVVIILIPTSE